MLPSASVLKQFVDNTHPVVFYGTDCAIDIPTYTAADHSLMFVHADIAEIASEIKEDKTCYRMLLGYNGVAYDLSVTDTNYIDALNSGQVCAGILSNFASHFRSVSSTRDGNINWWRR